MLKVAAYSIAAHFCHLMHTRRPNGSQGSRAGSVGLRLSARAAPAAHGEKDVRERREPGYFRAALPSGAPSAPGTMAYRPLTSLANVRLIAARTTFSPELRGSISLMPSASVRSSAVVTSSGATRAKTGG